jgi:hypothetical protein
MGGIGDGADSQNDFNQSALHSRHCFADITRNST